MNRGIYVLGLLGLLGCASGGNREGARGSLRAPELPAPEFAGPRSGSHAPRTPTASSPTARASASLEYHDESESDRVFIENAERAIREYSQFLSRAGDSPEYAEAVKRSRAQIDDLRDTLIFVRAGAAQRAAH